MNYRIAVNKQTGVMQSFLGDMTADGGGRNNTPSVVMVGATAAQSIYYFPKSDLSSVGLACAPSTPARRAVTARCKHGRHRDDGGCDWPPS
ncbi:hypothetical protein M8494_27095 [Serratia ureilytica]